MFNSIIQLFNKKYSFNPSVYNVRFFKKLDEVNVNCQVEKDLIIKYKLCRNIERGISFNGYKLEKYTLCLFPIKSTVSLFTASKN